MLRSAFGMALAMASLTDRDALRQLSLKPLPRPRPDAMRNLVLRIEMVDLNRVVRAAEDAAATLEIFSPSAGQPLALVLALSGSVHVRHQSPNLSE
jgi:hypothetical protein